MLPRVPPESGGLLLIVLAVDPSAGVSVEVDCSSSRAVSSVKGREIESGKGSPTSAAELDAGCCSNIALLLLRSGVLRSSRLVSIG